MECMRLSLLLSQSTCAISHTFTPTPEQTHSCRQTYTPIHKPLHRCPTVLGAGMSGINVECLIFRLAVK